MKRIVLCAIVLILSFAWCQTCFAPSGWYDSLQDAANVDKTAPTEDQALVWDDVLQLWIPEDIVTTTSGDAAYWRLDQTTNPPIDTVDIGGEDLITTGTVNVGTLTVNSAFTFPTADGSANQVLVTDGSDTLTWRGGTGTGSIGFWNRTGTFLLPVNAGDKISMGTGSVTAEQLTSTDDVTITDLLSAARGHFTATSPTMDTLRLKADTDIGTVTFTGTGDDDMDATGTFTATTNKDYKIEIDGTGDPDTFKWYDDGGGETQEENVEITEEVSQLLNNGVYIVFSSNTGHDSGDYWEFTATAYSGNLLEFQNVSGTIQGYATDQTFVLDAMDLHIDSDGGHIYLGETQDLDIVHSGSHSYIINKNVGTLRIENDVADQDLIFSIVDGAVGKLITWDADVDKLKHSAGLFDFHDDNIITTGSIEGEVLTDGVVWIEDGDILTTGTVGIGTTSPAAKLEVYTTTTGLGNGIRLNRSTTGYSTYEFATTGTVDWSIGQNSAANRLDIFEDGLGAQTRLSIIAGGNVGIGTNSPDNKLDVEGAVAVGASYSGSVTAPSNGMIIQGNVGIGTSAPSEKLEVAGDIEITDDTPHLRFWDTDNNITYEWHLDPEDTPYQNFGLWRGVSGDVSPNMPLMYFDDNDICYFPTANVDLVDNDLITTGDLSGAVGTFTGDVTVTGNIYTQGHWSTILEDMNLRMSNNKINNKFLSTSFGTDYKDGNKQTATLASGENQIHSFIFAKGYIFAGTRTSPAKFIRFNDLDDLTDTSVTTFIADNDHNNAESAVYDPTRDKIYILFGRSGYVNVTEYDPDTRAHSEKIDTNTEDAGTSGSITSDGTYLYIITRTSPAKILKYDFATYSLNDSATLTGFDNGHSIQYDGTNLYATGASSPAWVAKIDPSDLSFSTQAFAAGDNTAPDDFAIVGDYLFVGLESTDGIILRIKKSDLSLERIYTGQSTACYGTYFDGRYVWGVYATSPGTLVRLGPDTLEITSEAMATGENVLNSIISDGQRLFMTCWLSPAKVIRKSMFDFAGQSYRWADTAGDTNLLLDTSGNLTAAGIGDFGKLVVDTTTLVVNATSYLNKVGIGTATPYTLLDIGATTNNVFPLTIRGDIDNDGGYTGIAFNFEGGTSAYRKAVIMVEGTSGNILPNMHFLLNSTDNTANATKADARLSILNNGNVGIGEVAPQDTLEVNGTGLFKDKLKFTQDDGNEYIDSLNDGYMDYGATTGHRFNMAANTDVRLDLIGTTTSGALLWMEDEATLDIMCTTAATALSTRFFTNDGDGTDDNSLLLYGVGTQADQTDSEFFSLLFAQDTDTFELSTGKTGNGTVRDWAIFTEGSSQINLDATTGAIGIGIGIFHDGLVIRKAAEVQTTDAVQATVENITLLDENTYHVEAWVAAVKTDGSQRASYHIAGTFYRTGAGAATLQGAVTTVHSAESDAAWDATFTVDTNDVRVSVTGVAATTIKWGCTMKYINMGI